MGTICAALAHGLLLSAVYTPWIYLRCTSLAGCGRHACCRSRSAVAISSDRGNYRSVSMERLALIIMHASQSLAFSVCRRICTDVELF